MSSESHVRPGGPPVHGVMIATVEALEGDPQELGRIKVVFPVLGEMISAWAVVMAPFAGEEKGFFFPHGEGDTVVVAFQNGDFNLPIVIGGVWNGVQRPPVEAELALTQRKLKTQAGLQLIMDDDPEALKIELVDEAGNSITINTTEEKISIHANGEISLTADADISISAEGRVSISGAEVSVSAEAALELSADGEASLSADGETSVSGALVRIN